MASIRSHEDLEAWKLSDELEDRVYEITARPAAMKDRDFCADMQRAARSAPNNLSEGFARFRPRDNARFVRIAIGSLAETINHLRHAWKRKYITDAEHDEWRVLAKRARGASIKWLAYLESCAPDGPPRSNTDRRTSRKRQPGSRTQEDGSRIPNSEPEP